METGREVALYLTVMYNIHHMKRTQIYLTEEQWRDLKVRSRQESVSVAELVRQAVDEVYRKPGASFESALRSVAGLWADREDLDTEEYLRELRESDRV